MEKSFQTNLPMENACGLVAKTDMKYLFVEKLCAVCVWYFVLVNCNGNNMPNAISSNYSSGTYQSNIEILQQALDDIVHSKTF